MNTRDAVNSAKRLVVKVGSSSLTTASGGLDFMRLEALVDAIAARVATGTQVVLVSSGAIAAGIAPLGLKSRPKDLASQQAAASVGQLALAHAYGSSFARYQLTVGQVLLTAHDVIRRAHYRNAQQTLEKLLVLGAVPVVNENDTVATDEIRFGDNDRLAALVAHLISADALVLLSDVDGLYDGDPRQPGATFIADVDDPAILDTVAAGTTGASGLGTGGMASKVAAARLAAAAGTPVLLASAAFAGAALRDASVGTSFAANEQRMPSRKFWLGYAADAAGCLVLDDGAVTAVTKRRKSLLAAGITGYTGEFQAGDVVELTNTAGLSIARGLVNFDAAELPELIGHSTHELQADQRREVVHADDLVVLH